MNHFYPYILSCCLLLTGCVIDIALPGEGGDPAPAPVPDQEKVAVSFSSTIDLETRSGGTKADAPVLADDVQVTVHAYSQGGGTTPTAAAVVSRNYVASGGNGSLTVTGGEGRLMQQRHRLPWHPVRCRRPDNWLITPTIFIV